MEVKYEPIFGDQSLFDGAPEDAVSVIYGKSEYIFDSEEIKATTGQLRDAPVVAMRRIIKTPVWTVEDQKAGRLPDVGSKLIYTETWDAFEFVGVIAGSMRWACKDFQDGFLYFFEQSEMSPIESPEEKAQRLRDEWIDNACSFICFYDIGRVDAIKSLEITYDKLKSGELPMPVKDGE